MAVDRGPHRVLHLVASTDRRGAETAAVRLAGRLNTMGVRSDVMALAPGSTGGLDLPVCGASARSLATIRRVRAEAQDAALVIAHGSTTLPVTAAATLGSGVPFLYRSVGDPLAWINTPARRLRVRAAVHRSAAVVALWRGSAVAWHEVLGVPAGRLTVIPNAVSVDEFSPAAPDVRRRARADLRLPADGPVVACIGSLSREKRVDLAIDAVGLMGGGTLVIAGDGPERGALERLARPLEGRVRFLGQVVEPQWVLAAADVVVIPSATEGQPAVAIEAGLSGLPVVATRVGGLGEVITDGETGFLVPTADAVALAAAIRDAVERRGNRLGPAARRRCETHFDLDSVADRWRELIGSLISS